MFVFRFSRVLLLLTVGGRTAKIPFNQDECIQTYKRLIRSLPRANQYLLLYVLDLLSVFARKSEKNLMTATSMFVLHCSFWLTYVPS